MCTPKGIFSLFGLKEFGFRPCKPNQFRFKQCEPKKNLESNRVDQKDLDLNSLDSRNPDSDHVAQAFPNSSRMSSIGWASVVLESLFSFYCIQNGFNTLRTESKLSIVGCIYLMTCQFFESFKFFKLWIFLENVFTYLFSLVLPILCAKKSSWFEVVILISDLVPELSMLRPLGPDHGMFRMCRPKGIFRLFGLKECSFRQCEPNKFRFKPCEPRKLKFKPCGPKNYEFKQCGLKNSRFRPCEARVSGFKPCEFHWMSICCIRLAFLALSYTKRF